MKANGSKDPIMPKENYTQLNDLFATYFTKGLDSIGSLYFTKEVFDGTYPGYGSSYPDLQGGLGILFEQASSRGLNKNTLRPHYFSIYDKKPICFEFSHCSSCRRKQDITQRLSKSIFQKCVNAK